MMLETMPPLETVVPVLLIFILASFVKSSLGFGGGLFAVPLLSFVVGIQAATPLVAMLGASLSIGIVASNWRQIDVRATWRLILAGAVGIPLGLLFLKNIPEVIVLGFLGLFLIVYGIYRLGEFSLPQLEQEGLSYLFGFVAGLLGGAFSTGGPPIAVYGSLRGWPPQLFRATVQSYFLPTGVMIVTGQVVAGLWTPTVIWLFVYSLPVMLLMLLVGGRVASRMPAPLFAKVIHIFLLIVGVVLVVRVL